MSDTAEPAPDTEQGPSITEIVDHAEDVEIPLEHIAVVGDEPPVITEDPLWVRGYRTSIGEWRGVSKRRRKRKKLAKRGYVEWYVIDGSYPTPKFVKPEYDGGGIPDYKHDGTKYIFPENAAVPSARSGMPCFVHKKGEIEPINLRDPADHALAPDQVQEYLDTGLQTSEPSLFDGIDMSFGDMIFYGLIAIVGLAIAWSVMNGGLTT